MGKKKGKDSAPKEAGDNKNKPEQPSTSKQGAQSSRPQVGGDQPPQAQRAKSGKPQVGRDQPPQAQRAESEKPQVGRGQPTQAQRAESEKPQVGRDQPPQAQRAESEKPQVGRDQPAQGPPQPQGAWTSAPQVGRGQPTQAQRAESEKPQVGRGQPTQAQRAESEKPQVGRGQPTQAQRAKSGKPQVGRDQPPQAQRAKSEKPQVGRDQPGQGPPQPQGAWTSGPQVGRDQPPQGPPQPQGAWASGPQIGRGQPPQGPLQPQGAWTSGPQVGRDQPPQGPPQPQGAWASGPPIGRGQPPQGPPQPQGAWTSAPQVSRGQPAQGQPQPQGAWTSGPQIGRGQPPQGPPQPQGAWTSGPQVGRGQPAQGPPQPQGAWTSGPQVGRDQPGQGPPQPQGAWTSGPQVGRGQPAQGPPQPQGAWTSGPQIGRDQPPQGQPQPQGAWTSGPQIGRDQPPQGQPQPQGAWTSGPQVGRGQPPQSKAQSSGHKSSKSGSIEMESQRGSLIEFAPRIYAPKRSGREIQVASNFFRLFVLDPSITIFHYDVEMEPDKPKYLIRTVWNTFMSLIFPGRLTAFDGKNAYSKGPLTNEALVSATITVFNADNNNDKEFKVTIKEVRRIGLSCFHNFRERVLQDRSMKILPEAELSVLDIILKNFACDNFVRSGNSFFSPSSHNPRSIDLSEKLCLRFGYYQSTFMGYRLYMNFDLSHKAFYKNCSILEILHCFKIPRSEEIDVGQMTHFLRTVKVEYALPNNPSSKRIFRVNKLVNNAFNQSFTMEDGKEMTVLKYFETEKKCRLKYPDLPLLWVGPTQKSIYVPMEFCTIVPDQVYKGLMEPTETRFMVQKSTLNARDRRSNLQSVFNKINVNNHPLLQEFGLKVSNEMEKVPARVLDPPGLRTSRYIKVDRGVWRIQDFLNPVSLNKWCILNLDKYLKKENIDTLRNLIKNKGNDFNMRIADPTKSTINGDSSFMGLKKSFSQLKDMQMVFVIIPDTKLVYSRVKAICETQDGILTQCVKSRTVSQDPRKLSTTVQNILLKVNAKLGGRNHSLDQSSTPQCLNGYVMVVGADVTHSSPGMSIPSAVAVTVSYDPAAFQYSTTTRVQPKGEIIIDLENIMSEHVKEFYRVRKQYPEKIIFFRDGVSEGELKTVFQKELTALKRACKNYCQPKITFIVVQKRHHTRFYPTSEADEQDKNYNVPVGTCVDSEIVHPRDLNFYLVSHASLLGTARPTKYRLLHNDNNLTDEEIEKLSFYLCHLFARCNRSVSYPAPTYNAHLAAARVRAYLEGLNLMSGQDVKDIQSKMKDEISKISPMFFV